MGTKHSVRRIGAQSGNSRPGTSTAGNVTTQCQICGQDGYQKIASWWCRDCDEFLCNTCAWTHGNATSTSGHNLLPASMVPKPIPPKPATEQLVHQTKHAILVKNFDTRANLHYADVVNYNKWNMADLEEHERGDWLLPPLDLCCCRKRQIREPEALITGCAFVPGGYIAVTDYQNQEVKLFDSKFNCKAYKKLRGYKPTDICCHGNQLYVTLEAECWLQTLTVSVPVLILGRKLSMGGTIKTEGECDSVAICQFSTYSYGLILGMTFSPVYHTKRFQVHIVSMTGKVKYRLFYDDLGQRLFWGKVFVSSTTSPYEVIVSDKIGNHVRGFYVETGESLFYHYIREPLGLTVDTENNIYVITYACFYWIPPDRESVVPLLKRGHRSRSSNCCYDSRTKILCVSSCHSETVQMYELI